MADADRPRSPFAANIEFLDDAPIRSVTPVELAQILAAHDLYVTSNRQSGKRAHLESTDLSGQSFAGMKLWRVRMYRAELAGADFTGADLRKANMIGAKIQRGRLASADLTGGRLSGINLADANCKGACLAEADLEFAILANVVFKDADLRDADMSGVILDDADLSGANLRRVNLRGASLRDARLCDADLRDARLGGAILTRTSFKGADLRGAYLRVAKFDHTDLAGANLCGAQGLCWAYCSDQRADAHDVDDPLEIVGQHVQGHLGGNPFQRSHLEVGRSHPAFDGAEGVLDRLPAHAHGVGVLIEALFDGIENVLVLPARDTPLLTPKSDCRLLLISHSASISLAT